MQVFEITIPVKSPDRPILIDFSGDVHLGSKSCDVEMFEKAVTKTIKDKAYYVGMGDAVDSIVPADSRYDRADVSETKFIYNDVEWDLGSLDGQHAYYEMIMERIAKTGRLLGLHYGNHGSKVYVATTNNLMKGIAARTKCRFMGYFAHWKIHFSYKGKRINTITLVTWHGHGGSASPAGVINVHERLRKSFDADLYVCGHYHQLITFSRVRLGTDGKRSIGKFCWHGVSGSFLRTYRPGTDNYGCREAYDPLSVGFLRATIIPSKGITNLGVIDMDQEIGGV